MKSTYLFENAEEKEKKGLGFAIVTLIEKSGVSPRRSTRMIVYSDGSTSGTLGGGDAERQAAKDALLLIKEGKSEKRRYNVHQGGDVVLMFDTVERKKDVFIFGSGHFALALKDVFEYLKFRIHMIDAFYGEAEKEFKSEDADENSACIFTDHQNREKFFNEAERSRAFYIGCLSSRSRKVDLFDRRIYIPSGLDINSDTPEQVAICIAGEVFAAFNKKAGRSMRDERERLVIVRGAGDLATATIIRLKRAGYHVLALETAEPSSIRRTVSLSEAVYDKSATVEKEKAVLIDSAEDAFSAFDDGLIPILIDEKGEAIKKLRPTVVVDAIIAKKNLGTKIDDAELTIALGPGFHASRDVDFVIETQRGHNLGKVISSGEAAPNSGKPGIIEGFGEERVIHSPEDGKIRHFFSIGDIVRKGEIIARVGETDVPASIDGMLRGLIREGYECKKGLKIADIDPRGARAEYLTMSDKARAISGSVLEVVDSFFSSRPEL